MLIFLLLHSAPRWKKKLVCAKIIYDNNYAQVGQITCITMEIIFSKSSFRNDKTLLLIANERSGEVSLNSPR